MPAPPEVTALGRETGAVGQIQVHRFPRGGGWGHPPSGPTAGRGVGTRPLVAGGEGAGGVARSRKRSSSTGNGRTTVEFFSAATSTIVWSSRSCRAAGSWLITLAAADSF